MPPARMTLVIDLPQDWSEVVLEPVPGTRNLFAVVPREPEPVKLIDAHVEAVSERSKLTS